MLVTVSNQTCWQLFSNILFCNHTDSLFTDLSTEIAKYFECRARFKLKKKRKRLEGNFGPKKFESKKTSSIWNVSQCWNVWEGSFYNIDFRYCLSSHLCALSLFSLSLFVSWPRCLFLSIFILKFVIKKKNLLTF